MILSSIEYNILTRARLAVIAGRGGLDGRSAAFPNGSSLLCSRDKRRTTTDLQKGTHSMLSSAGSADNLNIAVLSLSVAISLLVSIAEQLLPLRRRHL
jgi:hypothetical protein